MLNKEICKNYQNTFADSIIEIGEEFELGSINAHWCELDEENWKKGMVTCPLSVNQHSAKVNSLPTGECLYQLEHLVSS